MSEMRRNENTDVVYSDTVPSGSTGRASKFVNATKKKFSDKSAACRSSGAEMRRAFVIEAPVFC
jgi:hypothetical protein